MTRAGLAIGALIPLVLLALLGWSARTRAFDPDEFQHLQMAWLIAIGQVPYRDFFEHHTPLWHLIASLGLRDPALTTDGDAAVRMLVLLRWTGIALSGAMLVLTAWIAARLAGRGAGMLAAILLASSAIFAIKGLEIRPDQLAGCGLLAATVALVEAQRRGALWLHALAGATSALAILTTQKLVFAVPGLAITFLAAVLMRDRNWRALLLPALAVGAGAVLASLPVLLWLASHGALSAFVTDNFLLGASWPRDSRPLVLTLSAMLRDETLFVLLAAIGTMSLFVRGWRGAIWPLAVVAPMLSMVALMPLFPVVQPQYLFLWMPYAAIVAALGGVALIERLGTKPMLRSATATIIAGAAALHGALAIKTQSTAYETRAFDVLRYTVTQTPPDATVLRAWSPGIAFRRPAFFYFSLHPEIRSVVPQRDWLALETGLRSGSIAPELIEMDDAMRAMPPGIVRALEDGWTPTGTGNLWRRKGR